MGDSIFTSIGIVYGFRNEAGASVVNERRKDELPKRGKSASIIGAQLDRDISRLPQPP